MTKFLLFLLAAATVAGIIWTIRAGGADGSWLLIVVPAALAILTMYIKYKRTGDPFSDNSGGY